MRGSGSGSTTCKLGVKAFRPVRLAIEGAWLTWSRIDPLCVGEREIEREEGERGKEGGRGG
jgi:hypothetical protein